MDLEDARGRVKFVLHDERPRANSRLAWPDRAWLALLAGTLPIERLAGMR
jgi:hypothetical protein